MIKTTGGTKTKQNVNVGDNERRGPRDPERVAILTKANSLFFLPPTRIVGETVGRLEQKNGGGVDGGW